MHRQNNITANIMLEVLNNTQSNETKSLLASKVSVTLNEKMCTLRNVEHYHTKEVLSQSASATTTKTTLKSLM